jgi:hypothetical protein
MKHLLIILLLIPSLAFGQVDKVYHAAAGATIGSMTYVTVNSFKDVSNRGSILISMSAVTIAGATKEMFDYKPDIKDFAFTELGGVAGVAITHLLTKKYFHKLAFYFDTKHISDKRYNYVGFVKNF